MTYRFTTILSVLLVGTYAGLVLFVAFTPSVRQLPDTEYLHLWKAWNRDFSRTAPPLLLGSLALLAATAYLARHDLLAATTTTIAAALLIATIAITVAGMEPLNRAADALTSSDIPASWEHTREHWMHLHLIRTVLAVTAFALLLAGHVGRHLPTADRELVAPTSRAEPVLHEPAPG